MNWSACFILFLSGLSVSAVAQPSTCTVEIPAGVVAQNGALTRGLVADSFVVEKGKDVSIQAAAYDSGARRVVFVLERGTGMNDAAQALAKAVIDQILQNARAGDEFGFVTAEEMPSTVPLGPPAEVLTKVHEILVAKPSKSKRSRVLDSLSKAAEWLAPAHTGDAIVVFTGEDPLEEKQTSYGKLYASLLASGIRVFGFLFGPLAPPPRQDSVYLRERGGNAPALVWANTLIDADMKNMPTLTRGSGGYLVQLSTQGTKTISSGYMELSPLASSTLTDEQVKRVASAGWQMYGAIAEFYRLTVERTSGREMPWKAGISGKAASQFPDRVVLTGSKLPACPNP